MLHGSNLRKYIWIQYGEIEEERKVISINHENFLFSRSLAGGMKNSELSMAEQSASNLFAISSLLFCSLMNWRKIDFLDGDFKMSRVSQWRKAIFISK